MPNATPILNNLYLTHAIKSRTISVFYYPDASFGEESDGGQLYFDGYDENYMLYNDFTYLPVLEPLLWAVPLNGASFGSLNLPIANITNLTADPYFNGSISPNRIIFDTGTSGIMFSTDVEQSILDFL
jgi:hypothetical protein